MKEDVSIPHLSDTVDHEFNSRELIKDTVNI